MIACHHIAIPNELMISVVADIPERIIRHHLPPDGRKIISNLTKKGKWEYKYRKCLDPTTNLLEIQRSIL